MDDTVKFSDSRSNGFRDIRGADFMSNEQTEPSLSQQCGRIGVSPKNWRTNINTHDFHAPADKSFAKQSRQHTHHHVPFLICNINVVCDYWNTNKDQRLGLLWRWGGGKKVGHTQDPLLRSVCELVMNKSSVAGITINQKCQCPLMVTIGRTRTNSWCQKAPNQSLYQWQKKVTKRPCHQFSVTSESLVGA